MNRTARTAALALAAILTLAACATTPTAQPTPAATAEALPTTPCATEDAAGPCYWDAALNGNGTGMSFWVMTDGTVLPDTAKMAAPAIVETETGLALTEDFTAEDSDDLAAAIGAMLDANQP